MSELDHVHETAWRMNRQVNLALVVTVVLQAAMAFWWAGGAAQRIVHLEEESDRLSDISVRMARLETQMTEVHGSVQRIENRIESK